MIILDPINVAAPGVFVSSNVPEDDAPAQSMTRVYAAGDRIMVAASHMLYESKTGVRSPVTLSIASPGVVNWAAHGLAAGTAISFETTGALPSGLAVNTVYYVLAPAANSFNVSATVGGSSVNFTGSQSGAHSGVAGPNFNRPVTDTANWLLAGATNRWKMFDDYNNTLTERAEVIEVQVKPSAIAQGLYLGNIEGREVEIISTDPVAGEVMHETISLVSFSSGSSFYRWLFGRRIQLTQILTLSLPLYYLATATVRIKNPGGIARCGMFRIGPIEDFGYSQYGLGRDIKDYSTTKFNFDGTSETIERGFSKRMNVDVLMDNDVIDFAQEWFESRRQKNMIYIGATKYRSTMLHGKCSSFKTVIEGYSQSKISLQIEGTV